MRADYLIKGGTVIDPANDVFEVLDVVVNNGVIAAVGRDLHRTWEATEIFNANGKYVCPGLIDLHVHVYHGATPLGVVPDETCLAKGVTTVVDAGSAGSATLPGMERFVVRPSKTRVLAFVHISVAGLAWAGMGQMAKEVGGELDNPKHLRAADAAKCLAENPSWVVGVKVRLQRQLADEGRNEKEGLSQAVRAAGGHPVMVHHCSSTLTSTDCLGALRGGDIYTHCFHAWGVPIVSPDPSHPTGSRINHAALDARKRGVVFDVGHGAGAFSWTVASAAAAHGFFPDTISTDLHAVSVNGSAYDLPSVATKMVALGMPFRDVVRAMTSTPAKVLRMDDRIGSLAVGREADITVLDVLPGKWDLEDCHRQLRQITKRIVAAAVWRRGVRLPVSFSHQWPNPNSGDASTLKDPDVVVSDKGWVRAPKL